MKEMLTQICPSRSIIIGFIVRCMGSRKTYISQLFCLSCCSGLIVTPIRFQLMPYFVWYELSAVTFLQKFRHLLATFLYILLWMRSEIVKGHSFKKEYTFSKQQQIYAFIFYIVHIGRKLEAQHYARTSHMSLPWPVEVLSNILGRDRLCLLCLELIIHWFRMSPLFSVLLRAKTSLALAKSV